ncbi:protein kinase [Candidatus Uabimicrobium sp. HlEnr_7]|uniref:protein kinase domain-containing protein n=1 Tax=Candidatus Uabimicrobium helgolandensis TaxID=3095367 RepID=UPI003555DBBE
MPQTLGQIKTYDTAHGTEEALCFAFEGKEHWIKRYLNNDRYQICGFLGTGGLGCVFTAYDRWNCDNMVVIKTPYYMGDYCFPYISRGKGVFERQIDCLNKIYRDEKKYLAELSNAGFDSVVNLNGFFFDRSVDLCRSFHNAARVKYQVSEEYRENAPFIVMKYIRGNTLGKIIQEKPLGNYKTLTIAKQILSLMKYMHKRRVSSKGKEHYYLLCDLKAENIIVTDDMHISLIDFGAVKVYSSSRGEVNIPIFVTDGYAAPEVYSGSLEFIDNPRIDERFDLFTLGALMAYCLTGKKPRDFLINTTPPQHNFDLASYDNITKNVKNIIKKSTMHQRQERYQDSSTMLYEALNELSRFQG